MDPEILKKKLDRANKKVDVLEGLLETKSRDLYLKNRSLEYAKNYVEKILNTLSEGIVVTNLGNKIQRVNPAFCRLLDLKPEEVIELNLSTFFDSHELLKKNLDGSIHELQDFEVEIHFKDKTITVLMSQRLLKTNRDELEIIYSFKDMSLRKEMEMQLLQYQKMESIGEITAGIAHEINTPLQYISDNLFFLNQELPQLLLGTGQKQLGAEEMAFLREEIPRALQQATNGVNKVRDISRALNFYSHPGESKKELTDLDTCIQNVITLTRGEWKKIGTLLYHAPKQKMETLLHPGEFSQVLINLILNSVHAISEIEDPHYEGVIEIKLSRKKRKILIAIKDNGPGIPSSIASKIFTPFFTTKPIGKGSGQGLAICQNVIVKKEGGKLELLSSQGAGAHFLITLPYAKTESDRQNK